MENFLWVEKIFKILADGTGGLVGIGGKLVDAGGSTLVDFGETAKEQIFKSGKVVKESQVPEQEPGERVLYDIGKFPDDAFAQFFSLFDLK